MNKLFASILITIMLAALVCGCAPEPTAMQAERYFVNCESDFVKQGNVIYFVEEGDQTRLCFVDVSTGEYMPVCGRPDCMHDGADCSAVISPLGFARLSMYENRLYWIEGGYGKGRLCCMETDGTGRRVEMELDEELYSMTYGRGTAEIKDGVLYVCGSSQTVKDGAPAFVNAVFAQPLGGGKAELIYRSEAQSAVFGRICGEKLYFAESQTWENAGADEPLALSLFAYDIPTGELAELYREERPNAYYRCLLADEAGLYLGGYHTAAVYSLKDGDLTVYDNGKRQIDVTADMLLRWPSSGVCSASDLNDEPLFEAKYPPDGIPGQPSGGLFIGASGGRVYYHMCFMSEDFGDMSWYVMELDTETREFRPLCSYTQSMDAWLQ